MLTYRAGTTWIAWTGLEVVELRDLALEFGSGAVGPGDLTAALDAHTAEILAALTTIGDIAIEVRYRHDPGRQQPRAAVIGRVRHTEERSAVLRAETLTNRLGRLRPVELRPIGADELRAEWLMALPRRPDWAVVGQRQIVASPAGRLWATERLTSTPEQWHGVLAALWESPHPTILTVRLEPVDGADHWAELHHLAGQIRMAATSRYDRAAGQLGVVSEIPPDPFAVAAQAPIDELMRLHDRSSFRFRIELAAIGPVSGRLTQRLQLLCPSRHFADSVERSGLDLRPVGPASLALLDQDQQNLTIFDLDPQTSDRGPVRPVVSRRVELAEAAGLFFVPRAQPRPTPGLPSALDALRTTGIPSAPFVFVSYDRRDLPFVQGLVRALRRWQMPYWWDGNLVGGDNIGDEIAAALHHPGCAVILVVIGPVASQRDWVASELRTAASYGRRFVAARVNHAPLPPDNRLCADLSNWLPDDQNDPNLVALIQHLGQHLNPLRR